MTEKILVLKKLLKILQGKLKTKIMKTVLKELMNGFDAYQLESQNDSITIEKLKEVIIKEYLKKEKEQIMYAYESGEKNIDFPALHGQGKLSDSNKYYDSNFGDKVEEAGI